MKSKSQTLRSITQPIPPSIPYQKTLKIHSTIYVQAAQNPNPKTTIIDIKHPSKILFHCYKKYKTFSFNMDYIYDQSKGEEFYGSCFGKDRVLGAVELGLNYMMICGGVGKGMADGRGRRGMERGRGMDRGEIEDLGVVGEMFYWQLVGVFERLVRDGSYQWILNVLAITDDNIYDLCNDRKPVQLRQIPSNRHPSQSQLHLIDIHESQPETPYQLLQLLSQSLHLKQKHPKSYFAIYCSLTSNKTSNKSKLLFIDSTKDMGGDRGWDNSSCLVLNKCILGVLNRMEGKEGKDGYAPWRDCRLTRIVKPFLLADSKVDAIGFINPADQDSPYSTLSLIKNLSRIKVPILKNLQNQSFLFSPKIQNPQIPTQTPQKPYHLLNNPQKSPIIQQHYQPTSPTHNRKISHPQSQPSKQKSLQQKHDLFEQIRKNTKEQIEENKKLNKIRFQLKLMKKKKEINLARILGGEKVQLLEDELEELEEEFMRKKEKEVLGHVQDINKSKIQIIQKSISKVQKLKLLKQYYTMAMMNQKEQAQQFQKSQLVLSKFYEDRLNYIDRSLKKSPKQLLEPDEEDEESKKSYRNKRYESNDKTEKQSLPSISAKRNKRVVYIKDKVKKGRVQYQQFLSKNVSQYKSYVLPPVQP